MPLRTSRAVNSSVRGRVPRYRAIMNTQKYRERLLELEKSLTSKTERSVAAGRAELIDSAHDTGDASVADEVASEQFSEAGQGAGALQESATRCFASTTGRTASASSTASQSRRSGSTRFRGRRGASSIRKSSRRSPGRERRRFSLIRGASPLGHPARALARRSARRPRESLPSGRIPTGPEVALGLLCLFLLLALCSLRLCSGSRVHLPIATGSSSRPRCFSSV